MAAPGQNNVDLDALLDLTEYDGVSYHSPSLSPSTTSKPTFASPITAAVPTPNITPTTQTLSGPSHNYDMYRQQTGFVPGAIANAMAVNQNNGGSFAEFGGIDYMSTFSPENDLFDFNTSPAQNTMSVSEVDMEFDSPAETQQFFSSTINPSSIEQETNSLPSPPVVPTQTGNVGRLWPGAHSQAALAKAQAQAQQRQQQQQQMMQQQPPQRQAPQQKGRSKSSQPTDPIVEQKITQLLNSMRAKPPSPDALSPPNLGGLPRSKKEEDDMDEDERLLASEEGKKLSSKERRQLRNKVSARAFRSRRKEYISQLESEIANKVNENGELRVQNRALIDENKRLSDLTRMLLSSPSFSNFLDHLSTNPSALPQGLPTKVEPQQQQQQQDQRQTPKDPNPFGAQQTQQQIGMAMIPEQNIDFSMLTLDNSAYNFQPQVFVVDTPELPAPIDASILSGKSSNLIEDTFTCDEEKIEVPVIERPAQVSKPMEQTEVAVIDEDFESDPDFALFHTESTATSESSQPEIDELVRANIFGGIQPEKALSRYELVDATEEEASAAVAMARVQRISANIESVNPHSIRILTLQPGRDDDPLIGSLSVEHIAAKPDYEAVSYVWGSDGRYAELAFDGGGVLALTQSACDALRRMRLRDRPRRLWADQVCINQADVPERSHQVSLMNSIYKNARHVLVWLGRDEEGVAERAVEMVHHLHDVFADEERHEAFRLMYSGDLSQFSKDPWLPLSMLTGLPWFNRLWIVQEIGTIAPATLFWGDAHIDWEKLSSVAVVLNQGYHHLRSHFRIFTPNIRYLYRRFIEPAEGYDENHNRGSFIYELHRARHLLSKDPRDHVYAFLGHFSIRTGSKSLAEIKVDYSRPIEEVYIDVAVRELRGASNLLLLSACHTVHANKLKRSSSFPVGPLPSWVPDWRLLPVHIIGAPTTLHRAAGDTKPKLTIDEARNVLHIDGLRIDTVATTSFTVFGNAFRMGRRTSKRRPIQALWTTVCGFDAFNLEDRYINGDPAFLAFAQTLTNACIGGDRASDYRPIPPEQGLANAAAFLVRIAEETDAENDDMVVSPELRALAAAGNPLQWSHEATLVTRHRRFAVTTKGYFVMGPDSMVEGDTLVVLYGGRTAFVLRESGDGWVLLGECYVHGLMNGEALGSEGAVEETFSIH
ncbi:BZIP-type transcription factor MBZ1 [Paramyrothecium foliicola]|nr:BZIP-type transcription factor MBZ1 [Paramyrothecium foliicola]